MLREELEKILAPFAQIVGTMPRLIEADPARSVVTVSSESEGLEHRGVWALLSEPSPTRAQDFLWSFTPHSGSDQSLVYVPRSMAAQAMSKVVEKMANLSLTESRHGRTSARSIAIGKRVETGNFTQYGHKMAFTPEEGHAYHLIFGFLLEEIQSRGFHDRMHPVPEDATDVVIFLNRQAVGFHQSCSPAWKDMNDDQRLQALKTFLYSKFSTSRDSSDPSEILPPPARRYRKSDISWSTFWMTREEIVQIATAAFDVYLRDAPFLGFR